MVVPKNSDGSIIEAEMSRFAGVQYCKTDLIASKGIVFVKFATSSAACVAMESVQMAGMVSGYKVKIMLAEPKTRRVEGGAQGFLQGLPAGLRGGLQPGLLPANFSSAGVGGGPLMINQSLSPGLLGGAGVNLQDFSSLRSAAALNSLGSGGGSFGPSGGGLSSLAGGSSLRGPSSQSLEMGSLNGQQGLGGGFGGLGGLNSDYMGLGGNFGGLSLASPMLSAAGLLGPHQHHQQQQMHQQQQHHQQQQQMQQHHHHYQQQQQHSEGLPNSRLFVVVHKSASEESLSALFRCYPDMEYLDLKRDRVTGRSKGFAYVNYMSPGAAGAAQSQLNGIEYPPGTGSRLKVLFAEPLGTLPSSRSEEVVVAAGIDGVSASGGTAAASHYSLNGGGGGSTSAASSISNSLGNSAAFQLPRGPPSGIGSLSQGSLAAAAAAAHQQQQQLSARTDLSAVSHDSLLSPRTSPLQHLTGNGNNSNNTNNDAAAAAAAATSVSVGMSSLLDSTTTTAATSVGELTAGLGGMTLMGALNNSGGGGGGTTSNSSTLTSVNAANTSNGTHTNGTLLTAFPPPLSNHHSPQTSASHESRVSDRSVGGDDGSWREHSPDHFSSGCTSSGVSPAKPHPSLTLPPLPYPDDGTVVYSALSRPLSGPALTHIFQQCGTVEFVRVLSDERMAMVKFTSPQGAAAAVGSLNGVEVLGEVLHVRSSPPVSGRAE